MCQLINFNNSISLSFSRFISCTTQIEFYVKLKNSIETKNIFTILIDLYVSLFND